MCRHVMKDKVKVAKEKAVTPSSPHTLLPLHHNLPILSPPFFLLHPHYLPLNCNPPLPPFLSGSFRLAPPSRHLFREEVEEEEM